MHASRASPESGAIRSSSHSSVACGLTATASSSARAGGPRRVARANTASRTLPGMPAPGAASTSVTKNALPPVLR